MATEEVVVEDMSSGKVHRRFRSEGSKVLAAYEGCNADQAGAYTVLVPAEVEAVEVDRLCRRCFPVA